MNIQYNSVTGLPNDPLDAIKNLDINPLFLLILVGILIIFYIIFSVVSENPNGNNGNVNGNGNGGIVFLEILLWAVFIILVLLNGIAYFFNIDIIASLQNIFSQEPNLQIRTKNYLAKDSTDNSYNDIQSQDDISYNKITSEVFNIPGNIYSYNQANALCQAYGAELATYQQIEDAYEKGADWCNYGWSADQLALFPTNIETWKKLRTIKGHENSCGRPGINGGYIANPHVRFGANCFGKKPKITGTEELLMENSSQFPQTVQELEMDKKINNFKNNLNNILISPFNNNNWSQH